SRGTGALGNVTPEGRKLRGSRSHGAALSPPRKTLRPAAAEPKTGAGFFSGRPPAACVRAASGRQSRDAKAAAARGATPHGPAVRIGDQPDPAGAAAPGPVRPGVLEDLRAALRPQDLRLVPRLEPAGRRRPGRHPERAAEAGGQAEHLPLRPGRQLPRLVEDAHAPRL